MRNASRLILAACAVLIVGTVEAPSASANDWTCTPALDSWNLELESVTVDGEARSLDDYDGLTFSLVEGNLSSTNLEVENTETNKVERIVFVLPDQIPEYVEATVSTNEDDS